MTQNTEKKVRFQNIAAFVAGSVVVATIWLLHNAERRSRIRQEYFKLLKNISEITLGDIARFIGRAFVLFFVPVPIILKEEVESND